MSRSIKLYTGVSGREMIDACIDQEYTIQNINNLYLAHKLSIFEFHRLKTLVNSNNKENLVLVKSILESKK